jgi:hypothetical protein
LGTGSFKTVANPQSEFKQLAAFDLSLRNTKKVDHAGLKRKVPVFYFDLKPRHRMLHLNSAEFVGALESGRENQKRIMFMLPPPSLAVGPASMGGEGDVQDAVFSDLHVDETTLGDLFWNRDPESMTGAWFALVKDSHLDNDNARRAFLERHFGQPSLKEVVHSVSPVDLKAVMVRAHEEITERKK